MAGPEPDPTPAAAAPAPAAAAVARDEAAIERAVARVLAAADPGDTLRLALEEFDARQDLASQAALFEQLCWRADIRHYWVFYRMSRVYAELGREDGAMLMAGFAACMQPEWEPTFTPYRELFRAFARRGMARAALDLFDRQTAFHPERPVAERHEILPLLDALGIGMAALDYAAPSRDASVRRDRRVIDAGIRPAAPVRVIGAAVPPRLLELSADMPRRAIEVAELRDAELLILRDAVAVRDAEGRLHADLSVCPYPELIARRFAAASDEPAGVERHEAGEAMLILDRFPSPNLAHFLLDQIARIELYRRAGADLLRGLVVGPALRTAYQLEIAARAGLPSVLDTGRVARVRAARLWVSTDCEAMQHPAHLGADWAIEHARAILGGRGAVGRRRLYVSRADARARRVVDEEALSAVLAEHGFETIVPGAMPYREQLEHFRTASHVIGLHGAALAHLVLCPQGARVLEIFHPLYGTPAFAILAQASGLDYAAMAGRDGATDAPELNDPRRADMGAGGFGERHVRVDLDLVRAWAAEAAG